MKISRADLFKRVWESPLRTLAKEFDISDVGLAKACRKHRIPTPPQGHWVRVALGRVSPPPNLPPFETAMVTLDARRHRLTSPPPDVLTPELSDLKVQVASSLDDLGPAAKRTFNMLSKMKPNASGFLMCAASNVFSCSISPETVQRAVLVLDAIERALPEIDATLVPDGTGKRLLAQCGGERIGLTLVEEYKRTETVVKHPKYSYLDSKEHQYHFSGRLKLTLDGDYQGRKSWADGVRARLEDKLGSVAAGLVAASAAAVALRNEREANRRHWEEEARRSAAIAEERRQRLNFTEKFIKEATAWRQFQDADAYLAHIVGQTDALQSPIPESSREWLAMATQLLAGMNPAKARMRILQAGPDTNGWQGRFGEAVVAN